jgi:hypothetical protein
MFPLGEWNQLTTTFDAEAPLQNKHAPTTASAQRIVTPKP